MKKFLSVLLIIVLVFSMTACAKSDPKASVSGYLDALKSGNIEEMNKYVKSDSEDQVKEVFNNENQMNEEAFLKAYSKLDYKILSSKVNGDTATVETEINAPNLGKIMTELIQEALPLAFAAAFKEDKSEDNMDDLMNTMLLDKVNSDDMPMVKKTVKIDLVKENNNWIINPSNDFTNAITGNLADMSKLFK
ncbi:DUF4878 domain-containing protein [Alkaliphilus sp. MSJ-5]|uniref:DUF4878 domain-containing protein n=1 Tax=Alkaliphilus flagellatus TaxID=2841507 RepID=A0ABS6G9C5_9FIRM|nr:DUF4878 domain-containing protein [Alkaliphilus flagellatus]MBU5677985.1 DUF4878 domain-containing protein [Alkaliphilus flagellatus]